MSDAPKYEFRPTQWTVAWERAAAWSDDATQIDIADEGDGEFVELTQTITALEGSARIRINPEEWETLKLAIDTAIKHCRAEGGYDAG